MNNFTPFYLLYIFGLRCVGLARLLLFMAWSPNVMKYDQATAEEFVRRVVELGTIPTKVLQQLCNERYFTDIVSNAMAVVALHNAPSHTTEYTQWCLDRDGLSEICVDVSRECVGSGSIAQVHSCTIKIQDEAVPGILKVVHPWVHLDMFIGVIFVRCVAMAVSLVTGNSINFESVIRNIMAQCDLRNERDNMLRYDRLMSPMKTRGFGWPTAYFASPDVVLMNRVAGKHVIQTRDCTTQDYDAIMTRMSFLFLYSSLVQGFYHGDFHMGNFLYDQANDCINIIDFGLCVESGKYHDNVLAVFLKAKHIGSDHDIYQMIRVFSVGTNLESITDVQLQQWRACVDSIPYRMNDEAYTHVANRMNELCVLHNLEINMDAVFYLYQFKHFNSMLFNRIDHLMFSANPFMMLSMLEHLQTSAEKRFVQSLLYTLICHENTTILPISCMV